MTCEIGQKVIDMFLYLSEGGKTVEITFTGGEPLSNFSVLKYLTNYAEKHIREAQMQPYFVIKTNGTMLNEEVTKFVKEHNMKVVVSIDGTSDVHDKHRRTLNGQNTHRVICRNVSNLIKNQIPCVASLTVLPDSSAEILKNIRYLFSRVGIKKFDVGPAYGTVLWEKADIISFTQSLLEVADYIREVNQNGKLIEVGPLFQESEHVGGFLSEVWGCHAASSNLAFLPDGQVTGCSALAMEIQRFPNLNLGNVFDGLNQNAVDNLLEVAQTSGKDRPACNGCNAATNCTGGCLAINYSTNGKALTPPAVYCNNISTIPEAWNRAWGIY